MSTKVVVMSPLHNLGASVSAALMAQGLTFDNKSSTLLFTDANSRLPNYLGIEEVNDPTRSVMQIVRLIDSGSIEDRDIIDYAFQYTKNAYMLNVADPTLPQEDRNTIVQHIFSRIPTDVVIVDNTADITEESTKDLLDIADALFVVTDLSPKCMEHFIAWMESPIIKSSTNVFALVVGYDEAVISLREVAKKLHLSANRVCKIHYNPWIKKCTMNGQLHTILPLSKQFDPRVANLDNDIVELTQCINSLAVLKLRRGF